MIDEAQLRYLRVGHHKHCADQKEESDIAEEKQVFSVTRVMGSNARPEGAPTHNGQDDHHAIDGRSDYGTLKPCSLGIDLRGGFVGTVGHGIMLIWIESIQVLIAYQPC